MESTPTSARDALRIQLGLSAADLARRAGISVDTVRKILHGKEGQATKVKAVDEALAEAAEKKGISASVAPTSAEPHGGHALADEQLMEFEVGGNFGVSVVVRGPVANHVELEDAVLKLIQGMNATTGKSTAGAEAD